jgi:hypothetical protein
MVSYVEIQSWDGDNRAGKTRIPVADVGLPTGYAAKVQAIIDALTANGVSNELIPDPLCIYGYRVLIDQAPRTTTPPTICDVRNTWEFIGKPVLAANGTKKWKFQTSGRFPSAGNVAAGTHGFLVDTANPAFGALVIALNSAAGVDMKTPYNLTASSSLIGGRALTSKRKGVATEPGLLPGQTGTISGIDLLFMDYARRKAIAQFPVASVALPSGYATKVQAIADALEDTANAGTALVVPDSIKKTRVVIETIISTTTPTGGDIGDVWKVLAQDNSVPENQFTFTLPCRNDDYSVTNPTDGTQVDPANQGWIDFLTALAAAGVDLKDPKVWANSATPQTAFAMTTSRKLVTS